VTPARRSWQRRAWLAVALVLAAIVASAFPASLTLDRGGLVAGEWWRIYTAPFVHADLAHGLLDVGALVILILAFGVPRRAWLLAFVGPVVIGLGTLLAYPQFSSTCGLSGLLHGLFVLTALERAQAEFGWRRAVFALAVLAVFAKATIETATGTPLLTGNAPLGAPIAFGAHLIGASVGLACGLFRVRLGRAEAARPAPAAARCARSTALPAGSRARRPGQS